ncbi:hypothetical protein [Moritella sp. 28]|uniref:hypothetical protein n=1 Tax=Moritella sp. 28 TaxID=2746232 RepID=UPI001BA6F10F|nr:hypothetical protein [Moritella sp. 28]QUM84619.1 hypothetical protein HWV02_08940 [Moritella sp. 28]
MKYLLSAFAISIVTLLTGCGGSDDYDLPPPTPTPKALEASSGGYVAVGDSNEHRSVDLSIYNTKTECCKFGMFTLKDLNGKTRFFTTRHIYSEYPEIRFEENIFSPPSSYMDYEFIDNGNKLKLTIKELDKSLVDLGLKVGQSIQLKRISQHEDFSVLEKLAFYSKDNKYDLELIKNKDGTAKIQGNQTDLGCKIEGTLNSTDASEDVGSFRVSSLDGKYRDLYTENNLRFSGCSDSDNDGMYLAAIYTYDRNGSQRIKLLISKRNVKDAISVELTAN